MVGILVSVGKRLSANQRALRAFVNHVLTEHKHKCKENAYAYDSYAYVAAVPTSALASYVDIYVHGLCLSLRRKCGPRFRVVKEKQSKSVSCFRHSRQNYSQIQ